MPFRSRAQQSYLYAKKPEIAEEFAKETPKKASKELPEHKETTKKRDPSAAHIRNRNGLMKISQKHMGKQ